ncbi:hypothetical protein F4X10_16760 [Candidatus Poribacteria bacterium]|nr:hypothetical protein [Candidatus Poribacteria bacterium]
MRGTGFWERAVKIEGWKFEQEKLESYTALELSKMEIEPVKWFIPEFLPSGLTILAGPPKIGKSFKRGILARMQGRKKKRLRTQAVTGFVPSLQSSLQCKDGCKEEAIYVVIDFKDSFKN